MRIRDIIISSTRPEQMNVIWARPVEKGFALYIPFNGKWEPVRIMKDMGTLDPDDDVPYDLDGMGATRLADLEDVALRNLSKDQVLKYNGSSWENGNDDVTPGPDTVGTAQIIDNSVIMDDLNDTVKEKIQKTYSQDDEALHMDYDVIAEEEENE